jgi:hypothetical protein
MSSSIKVSLLDSLYRARKNIERNKDIDKEIKKIILNR